MTVKALLGKHGWSSQGDRYAEMVEWLMFNGEYGDDFETLSATHNLGEEYNDQDFGETQLFVTDPRGYKVIMSKMIEEMKE